MARKSSNRIWWILSGVVVVLIAGLLVAKQLGWIGKPKPQVVEFVKVTRKDIKEQVNASGKVRPEVEVKISPDVSGEIIELHVQEGDSVIKGQLLLKIRPDNYLSQRERALASLNNSKAALEQSKAVMAQADARFVRAKATFDRNKKLFDDKVIPASEFEQIKADYAVAAHDIESAKANVEAARFNIQSAQANVSDASENLRKTTIFAPVSGIVSLLNVEQGERVVGTSQMAGTELLRIANLSNMEVRVNVNENDIVRVNIGDTTTIDVDAYSATGRTFTGIVREISNTANGLAATTAVTATDAVTEFEVKIKILNDSFSDLLLNRAKKSYPFKPGMTASVDIITQKKSNVLSVPISAVTTRNADNNTDDKNPNADADRNADTKAKVDKSTKKPKEIVFINSNGKAVAREVTTGISDFENIEILSGLKEGEELVSGPFIMVSKKLKDGDEIVKKPEESKKDKVKSNEKSN